MSLATVRRLRSQQSTRGLYRRPSAAPIEEEFTPYFEGETEINRRVNSQEWASNAAGETQLYAAKRSAEKALLQPGLSPAERENLMHVARTGFEKEDQNWFFDLLDKVTRPGNVVRTAILDFTQADQDFGTEITTKDYWDQLVGNREAIIARHGTDLFGDRGDASGSAVLRALGWEEQDTVGGKIARGVAAFGLDVITDPLSYLTFGTAGAGKTAAVSATNATMRTQGMHAVKGILEEVAEGGIRSLARESAIELADPLGRRMFGEMRKAVVDGFDDYALRKATEMAGKNADAEVISAIKAQLLGDAQFQRDVAELIATETLAGSSNRISQLVAKGQWKTLDAEFPEFMASTNVANFAKGGLRFTADPIGFFRHKAPTAAAGFRTNNPLRTPAAEELFKRASANPVVNGVQEGFRALVRSVGSPRERALRVAAREGDAWAAYAAINDVPEQMFALGLGEQLSTSLRNYVGSLGRVARDNGFDPNEAERLLSNMLGSTPGAHGRIVASAPEAVQEALTEQHGNVRKVLDRLASLLVEVTDGKFKMREGYFPLIADQGVIRLIRRHLADDVNYLTLPDNVPDDLKAGYELLSEYIGQLQRGTRAEGGVVLGTSKHQRHRDFGTTVAFPSDADVNVSMLSPDEFLSIAQADLAGDTFSLSWLNEQMGKALSHLLRKQNLPPLKEGQQFFNTSVTEVLDGYTKAIEGVIEAHLLLKSTKTLGAAKTGIWEIDAQRALAQLSRDLSPQRFQEMRALWESVDTERVVGTKLKRVDLLGRGKDAIYINLPAEIADNPAVRAAVSTFRETLKRNRQRTRAIDRAILRSQKALEKKGLPPSLARRAAEAPLGDALDEVRKAVLEVAQREATDLVDVARTTVNTFHGNVQARNAAIDAARKQARELVAAARKELAGLEKLRPDATLRASTAVDAVPQRVEPTPEVLRELSRRALANTEPTPASMTPSNSTFLAALSEAGDEDVARVLAVNGDALHEILGDAMDELFDLLRVTDDGITISLLADLDEDAFLEFLAGGRGVVRPAELISDGVDSLEESVTNALLVAATERGLKSTTDYVSRVRSRLKRTLRTEMRAAGVDWDFKGNVRATDVEPRPVDLAEMTDAAIEDWVLDNYDEYVTLMSEALGVPKSRFRTVQEGFVEEGGGALYVQPEPTTIPAKGATIKETLKEIRTLLGDTSLSGHEALRLGDTVKDQLSPNARRTLDAIQDGGIEGFEVERYLNLSESIASTVVRNPRGMAREDTTALMSGWSKLSRQLERLMEEPTPSRLRLLRDTYYGKGQPAMKNLLRRVMDADEFAKWDQTMGLIELAYDPKIPGHWQDAAEAAYARVSGQAAADLLENPWDDLMAVVMDAEGNALSSRSTAVRLLRRIQQQFVEKFVDYGAVADPRTGEIVLRDGADVFASPEFKQRFRDFANEAKDTAKALRQLANEVADKELGQQLKEQAGLLERAVKGGLTGGRVRAGLRKDGLQNIEKFGFTVADETESLDVPLWLGQMIENSLTRSASLYRPEVLSGISAMWRQYHSWFKASVTVGRLGAFLGNNVLGGLWNAWMAGVGPGDVPRIGAQVIRFRNAQRNFLPWDEALASVDDWFRPHLEAGIKAGVIGGGFAGQDLQRIVDLSGGLQDRLLRKESLKFWSTDDWIGFQLGGRGMEISEDAMRMAVFAKFHDPSDPNSWVLARDAVNYTQFDYADLTNVERSIQNFVPFWTWTARNIPVQIRTAIEQPRVMARYSYLMNAVDDNWSADDELFNEWGIPYSTGRAVVVGQLGEGAFASRVIFDPRLPITDLAELFEGISSPLGWRDYVGGQFGPWFSFAELDMSDDTVRSRVNAPLGMNEVARFTSSIGIGDPIVSAQGDWQIPRWVRSSFESAFPMWTYLVEDWSPSDPRRRQRAGWQNPEDVTLGDRVRGPALRQARSLGFRLSPPTDIMSEAAQSRQSVQDILDRMKIEGRFDEEIARQR